MAEGLNELLGGLIRFEYPEEVIKSAWRRAKKASPGTMSNIRKQNSLLDWYNRATPHIDDIAAKLKKFRMNTSVPESPGTTSELNDRLDRLIQFQDPRPRNPLGEFTKSDTGVPDPNTMARTYQSGKHSGIAEGGALAVLGGAGGAAGGDLYKLIRNKIKLARRARL